MALQMEPRDKKTEYGWMLVVLALFVQRHIYPITIIAVMLFLVLGYWHCGK